MFCRKCNTDKPLEEMLKSGKLKNGEQRYRFCCKDCNREIGNARFRKYRENLTDAQKEREILKKKEWYIKNRERIDLQNKIYLLENIEISTLKRLRARAKKEKIEFNLTIEDIIIPDICPLLEIPIKVNYKASRFNSISCDRLDPSKGYIKGNIRFISQLANQMKNQATPEQLRTFCKNIENYLKDYDIV